MKKLYLSIFLLLLVLTLGFSFAQQDFSNVAIKTTKVAGNVYMLEGRGGNIGVSVGDDGVLMIDDQFAPLSDKIRAAIQKLGGDSPKFILNTHHHGDHTGGNANFAKGSTIIAHENVRKNLSNKPQAAWPVITFDNSLSLHMNGEEIRAVHYPSGHTDGDAVIYFIGSNVVHMGDDFFAGRFPYVDLNNGGSVQGLIKNIANIMSELKLDVKIIPGHGRLSGIEDLKTYQRMLEETSSIVQKGMERGKSLAELHSAGLPSEWQSWGSGFVNTEKWIATIFNSLSAEMSRK